MKSRMEATSHFPQSLRAGADAFQSLFARIGEISGETVFRFGEDIDGRDYVAMSKAIEASLRAALDDSDAQRREGYLRAMTDFLCIASDGGAPAVDTPDPLITTAPAFSGYA